MAVQTRILFEAQGGRSARARYAGTGVLFDEICMEGDGLNHTRLSGASRSNHYSTMTALARAVFFSLDVACLDARRKPYKADQ